MKASKHRFARAVAGLAAALVALGASGCSHTGGGTSSSGGSSSSTPHVLRIGDSQDFEALNPHLDPSVTTAWLAELWAAYLFRSNARNEEVPELATVVPSRTNGGISADGRTITVHLRRGVHWSDGAPFDADDVVFSINTILNPKNNEVTRDGWDLIDRTSEPDKYTVVLHLKQQLSSVLDSLFSTPQAICILPKHILGNLATINTTPYNSKPVGIGPFRVVEWARNDHVLLEANPNYWRGKPKLERIVFRLLPDSNTALVQLQTGEIDALADVPPAFSARAAALPGVTVVHVPQFAYMHVEFNLTHAMFADVKVRRALRLALNRAPMVNKVMRGTATADNEAPTPAGNPMYSAVSRAPYDPAAANRLLDAAGWVRGADGIRTKGGQRLAFTLSFASGAPVIDQLYEFMRADWKAVGAEVSAKHVQPGLLFGPASAGGVLNGGKFDTVIYALTLDTAGDFYGVLGCNNFSPHGQNTTHYCDPTLEADMLKVRATYDLGPRRAAVHAVLARVDDQVPEIVIYHRQQYQAFHANVSGWHPNSVAPFDDFLAVDVK